MTDPAMSMQRYREARANNTDTILVNKQQFIDMLVLGGLSQKDAERQAAFSAALESSVLCDGKWLKIDNSVNGGIDAPAETV